ncbi:hypothetical protein psyc5s11_15680 [Clostridium gelidum]|uniref:Uncharacterized protein n=1 Tax=Clostridium gelidum TaxID=704125 RepID=A0ABM7T0S7_9CLOT|nr:hypothetical protein [Clostridium gelidum]BCZ45501.1 hypothetical protein psyc5s11_15680 [Clostridium gelidum]
MQTKIYNSLIGGASLEGKVLAVEGEKVKLHLSIDENQNEDEATWFPYAPPTGNIMYSMPVVGTSARLYFSNESSEEPIITGCVRTNGISCAKTSDTTKRYLGTEHGSEIEMIPDAINIKGGSNDPLSIKFEDNVGITLTSHKKLSLNATDEIIIKTPKSVKLNAQSQIAIVKTNAGSGMAIEGDLNYKSNTVILEGTDKEPFSDFDDDEPKLGQKPEPEPPKKPFNWGGVIGAVVLVGAAVVIGVAVGVPVLAVLACAAIGAVVCGAVDAGVQYAQYKEDDPKNKDGSKKSFGDVYRLDNTIIAACSGAQSAALAATPIGRVGQGFINGGIGGVQAIENGQSVNDIAIATTTGFVVGLAGGAGYIPYLPKGFKLPTSYYTTEASKAIEKGVEYGVAASGVTNFTNYIVKKAKECFSNKSQENLDIVPAT